MRFILVALLSVTVASCATVKKDATVAGQAAYDCLKADIMQIDPSKGIAVIAEVAAAIIDGSDSWESTLVDIGKSFGSAVEACAVKAVAAVLTAPNGDHAAMSMSPAAARALGLISKQGWSYL